MAELNFDSRVNYQKITISGSVDLVVGTTETAKTHTIAHGLGYAPNVRVWFTNGNGDISTAVTDAARGNLYPITNAYAARACHYTADATNVTITLHRGFTSGATVSATIYYRIYVDAA